MPNKNKSTKPCARRTTTADAKGLRAAGTARTIRIAAKRVLEVDVAALAAKHMPIRVVAFLLNKI